MSEPVVLIDGWTLVQEGQCMCLFGRVTGHPSIPNGNRVLTSAIAHLRGQFVVTASGHKYLLGKPFGDTQLVVRKAGQA